MGSVLSYTAEYIAEQLSNLQDAVNGKQPSGNYADLGHGHAGAATEAYVDASVGALQDQSVSAEDLFVSVIREVTIPNSGLTTIPLFICPFPLRLTSLALVSFQTTQNVTTSDTNWWLTRVRYTRQSVSTTAQNIATKTTRVTAGAEPAGEAITSVKPWRYNTSNFPNVSMQTDDTISMVFSPNGTPSTILTPICITVGYSPL